MAATAAAVPIVDSSPGPARRGRPPKVPSSPAAEAPGSPVSPLEAAGGDYEQERAARIRENMERMQKLGILDLAQSLTNSAAAAGASGGGSGKGRRRRKPLEPGSVPEAKVKPAPPAPSRRSARLKSVDPVSYCEIQPKKEKDHDGGRTEFLEVGAKEEIYTEEHEKLLGTCNTPWTLFVDGYDKDGKRIYDQVRGQTCHQCRQKTLGHHTSCSECQIVQGQFCGDCLYMRMLMCSFVQVVKLGYKSVAHYLIATQRASASSEDSSAADCSNKLLSDKSETSCISEHEATASKDSQEDGETSSKAKQSKATRRQVKHSDGNKDCSRSESVMTSDSQDDQANKDAGCVTPLSKPSKPASRKRKYERSPDCVASRLRSRSNKP
nr:unnamed protein product [Digitaria exilis]